MKKYVLLTILLSFILLAACQEQPEVAPTLESATQPVLTETAPTEAAFTEAAPTEAPPVAAATETPAGEATPAPPGLCDLVDPTLIGLDMQGLFTEWQADCAPAVPFGQEGPIFVAIPEHVQINFNGRNPESRQPNEPVIYIIPAEAYRALWDEAGNPVVGERLDQLHGWIDRQPSAVPTQGMPVLPMDEASAVNDLAVQGHYLNFETWDGIRFVGRFGQGPTPVTNENLRYIFQGFAGENDELLIAAFFPVTTPHLPANSAEMTPEEISAFEANPTGAINLAAVELNALTDADWQPALNLLDDLVGSLQYGGTETGQEAPTVEPEEGNPPSYAIVNAAAGVNIRSGPSTAFPVVGFAQYGAQLELIGRSLDGQWWVTPVQSAPDGRGWVSAPYVDAFNAADLPIMSAPPPPATPTPVPTPAAPSIAFWADQTTINQGQCTTLRWSVENIQAVWVYPQGENFENFPVTGDGSRQVCPSQTTTYEMRVLLRDGSVTTSQVQINVNPGNTLVNTNWVLSSFSNGQPLLPGDPPTISFGTSNVVSGFGGCNTFSGNYSVFPPNGLAISVGSRSMMACAEDVTAQEATYLQALQGTGGFEISGNTLILRDSGGVETLRFFRQ
jgi:heat shock protein HslJ